MRESDLLLLSKESKGVKMDRYIWGRIFPKGCWRSLYKPPIEKRTADLQWRVIHWAIATNKHVALFDSNVVKECVFCNVEESIDHLFLYCFRLRRIFQTLEDWFRKLGEVFSPVNFIFGLKYVAAKKDNNVFDKLYSGWSKVSNMVDKKEEIKRWMFSGSRIDV